MDICGEKQNKELDTYWVDQLSELVCTRVRKYCTLGGCQDGNRRFCTSGWPRFINSRLVSYSR